MVMPGLITLWLDEARQAQEPMSMNDPTPGKQRKPLPNGYHQGIVTAVTIFIGFSLAFLRF